MLPFVMRTLSGITPPLYCAFQNNHRARTPRHDNYNRYDELGTAQFVTLVLGSDGIHKLLVYIIIQPFVIRTLSGITPPLYCAFQINHHARTPRHDNYNRYDELGTAQFVTLVLGSEWYT